LRSHLWGQAKRAVKLTEEERAVYEHRWLCNDLNHGSVRKYRVRVRRN
jgi:hypothetical protein